VRVVDTHCHLGHVDDDPRLAVAEALEAGVELIVDIGMGIAESDAAVQRAERSDGSIKASVGLHPNDLDAFSDDAMSALADLAVSDAVVAIGETGLDFYRDRSPRERQEASFRAHVELAKATGKTLVIHCRDAHDAVIDVLDDTGAPERVVMHCFSGDVAHARACVERGFYCSFAGNVTYRTAEPLRDAARTVPAELLLVETDAPFLAPVPMRGKRNRPAFVVHTARALAEMLDIDANEFGERTCVNARSAFGMS